MYHLGFTDGSQGYLFEEEKESDDKTIQSIKSYSAKEDRFTAIEKDLNKVEGGSINTLMKGTLIQELENSTKLPAGIPKNVLKNYIATLTDDNKLYDILTTMLTSVEKNL
ncbi:MAG: hypothetical protein GXP45_02630 [bacterium]|nr:hypothetical protein [bacterium]